MPEATFTFTQNIQKFESHCTSDVLSLLENLVDDEALQADEHVVENSDNFGIVFAVE